MTEWWEALRVDHGQMARWNLGPFRLAVGNLPGEWQVGFERDRNQEGESDASFVEVRSFEPLHMETVERYASHSETTALQLMPALADRSLVVWPRVPLFIPQGEEIRIFVGSPVWVRLLAGESRQQLLELPVKRLSDTWFGPSTLVGELSYALRTQARLAIDEIPIRPYRIITPVVLRNEARETLAVERLNLPVPLLSIYVAETGRLWTEALELRHRADSGLAVVDVGGPAPPEAGSAKRLAGPRRRPEKNALVRAFARVWSSGDGGDVQ